MSIRREKHGFKRFFAVDWLNLVSILIRLASIRAK